MWTAHHTETLKHVTLVTTRSSGSSYLNRVELQNGCLSLGHANTFIPSTLAGSCLDSPAGSVNYNKLCENLELAVDVYISRVSGCSCGDSVIHLIKGSKESKHLKDREKLLIFLKGSKKAKATLWRNDRELYTHFEFVWNIRTRHLVSSLPSQYVFMLLCCYQVDCPHPICQKGKPTSLLTWFCNGPLVTMLPLPKIDKSRGWGRQCQSCMGSCSGHYFCEVVDVTDKEAMSSIASPPSTILKELFSKAHIETEDDGFIEKASQQVLLKPDDTKIWLEHLRTIMQN